MVLQRVPNRSSSLIDSGPPARVFRGSSRRTGFTLVELLVVIAIISILAGLIVGTLGIAYTEADKLECSSNLRQIATYARLHADGSSRRFFPYGSGDHPPAHESMNVLVRTHDARSLDPRLLVCSTWRGEVAVPDANGKYEVTAETLSYTMPDQRLSPTDVGLPLSSDKHVKRGEQLSGHPGGMNVVFTDGHVEFVPEADLGPDGLPEGLVR